MTTLNFRDSPPCVPSIYQPPPPTHLKFPTRPTGAYRQTPSILGFLPDPPTTLRSPTTTDPSSGLRPEPCPRAPKPAAPSSSLLSATPDTRTSCSHHRSTCAPARVTRWPSPAISRRRTSRTSPSPLGVLPAGAAPPARNQPSAAPATSGGLRIYSARPLCRRAMDGLGALSRRRSSSSATTGRIRPGTP